MKFLFTVIFILIFPLSGHTLRRTGGPTPVLHSVLDAVPPCEPQKFLPLTLAYKPDADSSRFHVKPGVNYAHKRRTGLRLLIVGGTLIAFGAALAATSGTRARNHPSKDGESGAVLGAYAAAMGLGLAIPGLRLRLKYRKRNVPINSP